MEQTQPILVWHFYEAPKELRDLSTNGGDEDWLSEVPPQWQKDDINWMWPNTQYGCFSVDWYDHPTKPDWHVVIGSHA